MGASSNSRADHIERVQGVRFPVSFRCMRAGLKNIISAAALIYLYLQDVLKESIIYFRSYLKVRISVRDQDEAEDQPAGILKYVEDLIRGLNADIGRKDCFELASKSRQLFVGCIKTSFRGYHFSLLFQVTNDL
jgi:hypothetical protein